MLAVKLEIRGIGETITEVFECDEIHLAKPPMGIGLIFVTQNLKGVENNRFVRLNTIINFHTYPVLKEN